MTTQMLSAATCPHCKDYVGKCPYCHTAVLTISERDLLQWLSREDFSQYGECHGKDLDALIAAGLAQVHGPGEHQSFIANDWNGTKGMMYYAVSLTEAGWAKAKELRNALNKDAP